MPSEEGRARVPFRARWWTDLLSDAWSAQRDAVVHGWRAKSVDTRPLADDHAEDALALGFGGRRVYPAVAAWEGELEAHLRREWDSNGPVDCPWPRAAPAVRSGWEHGIAVAPSQRTRR